MIWTIFAAEEPNSWLLPGDINEVYWGSAAFFIVLGLFLWKGLGPTKAFFANRTKGIADDLAAADRATAEAAELRAEQERSFAHVDDEAASIVAEARARAETLEADLRRRAETDVEAVKQRARIEIEAAKTQALADLRADVAARTVHAAEAVVDNSLDERTHSELIEQYISQVGATA